MEQNEGQKSYATLFFCKKLFGSKLKLCEPMPIHIISTANHDFVRSKHSCLNPVLTVFELHITTQFYCFSITDFRLYSFIKVTSVHTSKLNIHTYLYPYSLQTTPSNTGKLGENFITIQI